MLSATDIGLLPLLILAVLYFVPTIVALIRNVTNRGSVIVINLFLGWTVIGWVAALAMAARTQTITKTAQAPDPSMPAPDMSSRTGPPA